MAWQPLTLTTPTMSALAAQQGVELLQFSPWSHGVAESGDGASWLSFPNAVAAVVERLPMNTQAVFAVAVSSSSLAALAGQLTNLAAVLPLKQVLAAARQAATRADLALSKLELIEAPKLADKVPLNQIKTVNEQLKKALSVQALANAQALNGVNPLADLQTLAADKLAADAAVNTPLPALNGGVGWRFYADADIANALRTGHPADDQTLTVMLVFVGTADSLAFLRELMP